MEALVGAEPSERRRATSVDGDDSGETPGGKVVERVGERFVGGPRRDAERIEEGCRAGRVGAVGGTETDFAAGELAKVGDVARGDDLDRLAAELGDQRRALAPGGARLRVGDERVERRDREIGAVAVDCGAQRGDRDAAGDDLAVGAALVHSRDEVAGEPRLRRRRWDRRAR